MLADSRADRDSSGTLSRTVQLEAASLHALLRFIAGELPRWRDRPERDHETSEPAMTSQFCAHLSSAAPAAGWDFLQFRTEECDSTRKARKLDLVAAPRAAVVEVNARRCYDMHYFLAIECKRLPTPKERKRDEREYVFSEHGSRGGIQRFKAGHHASRDTLAGMIGYMEEQSAAFWLQAISTWISALGESHPEWSAGDIPIFAASNEASGLTICRSRHTRADGLPDIELWHLWVDMTK